MAPLLFVEILTESRGPSRKKEGVQNIVHTVTFKRNWDMTTPLAYRCVVVLFVYIVAGALFYILPIEPRVWCKLWKQRFVTTVTLFVTLVVSCQNSEHTRNAFVWTFLFPHHKFFSFPFCSPFRSVSLLFKKNWQIRKCRATQRHTLGGHCVFYFHLRLVWPVMSVIQ